MNALLNKHSVKISGRGEPTIVFAHGFGCDQAMWRYVAPKFESDYRVVLFNLAGTGGASDVDYTSAKYNSLESYARDFVSIAEALDLKDAVLVGHSVSAMIGVLASNRVPDRFSRVVLVSPSPRYLNDTSYFGGFEREDIDGLLESLSNNYLGWSSVMAPMIMGNDDRPELGEELNASFCRINPEIAQNFARVTFLSDNRRDLNKLKAKALILQCADDRIAPTAVGEYVHSQIPGSELVYMKATGHCPNLSAPDETAEAIRKFLA